MPCIRVVEVVSRVTMTLVIALLLPVRSHAQQVTAAAGGEGVSGGLRVAWTIGEPVVATGTAANVVATQGFHQPPSDFSTAVVPITSIADWQLYPNPTRGLLQLSTTSSEAHHAVVLNALGQRVDTWSINASANAWSVDHLASGAYRLRVFDRSNTEIRTIPFIVSQ